MICAGIDAGSRATKVVLFDSEKGSILGTGIADQGIAQDQVASELLEQVSSRAGCERDGIRAIVATGYGRNAITAANTTVTEITCHARGVHHLFPAARTILEIGGQDSKCIILEEGGRVRDFSMNDRCAAGSGRFLEIVAGRLGENLAGLSVLSGQSSEAATISSMCAVFAETEIIGLLAQKVSPADIAAGVQKAIASRVATMAGRSVQPPVVFTGGVALLSGMVDALQVALKCPVTVSGMPQYTGALGAAILAARMEPGRSGERKPGL